MGRHYLYFFQNEEYIVFFLPQNEDIETVCRAYAKNFYNPPSPKHYMRQMLRLILKENSFQFNGKLYLQTHRTAMAQRQQFPLPKFSCHTLKHKV